MNTFEADRERGIRVEEKALAIIQKKYPCATMIDAYKGYDIWIPELHKSIEIKYDPMSNRTGNIVIEIEMSGKPSALITTTADYWVFYDDHIFVMIKPMSIINCIFQQKLHYVEFVGEGDTKSKKAFLVPKDVLFKLGKQLEA